MNTYRPASAVRRIAEDLIPKHHAHLDGIRIEYVFRDKRSVSAGKEVWGKARKVSGLNAYLATDEVDEMGNAVEDFFVIEIAEDIWVLLSEAQRVALVDHELCHCTVDLDEKTDELKPAMRSHDVEEFRQVVERHGFWRGDVKAFAHACEQQQLDLSA